MNDLNELLRRYSVKHDKKIKDICSPLSKFLGIPHFTYYFIEADGTFGCIASNIEFMEYYYSENVFLHNPYMGHPDLFRSGYAFLPCTFDDNVQKFLLKRFLANHLFLMLKKSEGRVEGFIFADSFLDLQKSSHYMSQVDLLVKFGRYFKREAVDLIGKLQTDRFNMQKYRQDDFLVVTPDLPLVASNEQTQQFLKSISGLTPQEERCLELFRLGKSAQNTGAILGISNRTVETHFENMKRKLGCASKWDLLDY